ncbi:hypothetical protein IJG29_02360 [Candidatus Saccharibacteria bacterium]|nr:hypothetical protein [Candidatus Saccharibacteria bacterium]
MSKAFTVLPMSQDMYLEAGKTFTGSITVANPADASGDFYYAVSVSPYSVVDENYTADLATMSDRSAIVKWIEIENPTGVLKPNESVKVNFKINVPLDAPSGGQYAAIAVRSNEEATDTGGVSVQNVFELASLLLANVAGETKHEGSILENQIPGFITNGSPTVTALLTNDGNVHETAKVTIHVKNAITGETMFPKEGQSDEFIELVMPGTNRYIARSLDDLPSLGIYSVSQDISYLGGSSYNSTVMISCPIWFLVLFIVTIGAIVGTTIALVRKKMMRKKLHTEM